MKAKYPNKILKPVFKNQDPGNFRDLLLQFKITCHKKTLCIAVEGFLLSIDDINQPI